MKIDGISTGAAALILAASLAAATSSGQVTSTNLRLAPAAEGCPVCDLWVQYEDVILRARQEVGPLASGVLYFYHSESPNVIEPLIRFANERAEMDEALTSNADLASRLGGSCGHALRLGGPVNLEISSSARGIFALLTSADDPTVKLLRAQAGRAVRSKIPVWF